MNRRSFFKFLGIGVATASVAPKMLAEGSIPMSGEPINKVPFKPKPQCVAHHPEEFMTNKQFIEEAGRQADNKWRQSLLPDEVRIPDDVLKFYVSLTRREHNALGISDIELMKRIKRNG